MITRQVSRLLPLLVAWSAGLVVLGSAGSAEARAATALQERRDGDRDDSRKGDDKGRDGDHGRGDGDDVSIAILQPKNGATVSSSRISVTVSWSVEPEEKRGRKSGLVNLIALRLDGKDVAFYANVGHDRSGSFTFDNVDLSADAAAKKPAVLVARAFLTPPPDHAFKDSAPVRITVAASQDATPPVISGLAPAPGSFTRLLQPVISATVTDAGGAGVDGASIVLTLDGVAVVPVLTVANPNTVQLSFTPPSPLAPGAHAVTVGAKDLTGNAAAPLTGSFTIDPFPPLITNLQPVSGSTLGNSKPPIAGTITDSGGSGVDPASIVLRLDGVAAAPTVMFSGGNTVATVSFNPPAPIAPGLHTVTLDARDLAGNAAVTASSSFSLDLTAPVLTSPLPAPGSFLRSPSPTVSATLTDTGGAGVDPSTLLMRLDGVAVTPVVTVANANQAIASFIPASALASGLHSITVDGKDAAGNAAATLSWTFTVDLVPPVVSTLLPANGSFANVPKPVLSAAISDTGGSGVDPASVVLRLDGSPVPAVLVVAPDFSSATASFAPASALPEGSHTFTVDAKDRAGNAAATAASTFTLDTLPPVLSAASPADGSTVTSPTTSVSAAWSDMGSGLSLSSAVVAVDGINVTGSALIGPAGFSFAPLTPWSPGPHAVTARIQDRAGNQGTLSWGFSVMGPPPAPGGLLATAGDGQVTLSWAPSPGAASYKVFRALVSGGYVFTTPLASGISGPAYLDTTAVNGTTYFYVVEATNAAGDSGPSNERSATPTAGTPPAPSGLVATAGNNQVSLSWTASAGATSYKVFRALVSGGYVFTAPLASGISGPAYLDTTAVNGTTYFYVVEATNAAGDSGPSNERSAMPTAGTPPAPVLQSAVLSNGIVTLTWASVSGAQTYKVFQSSSSGVYGLPIAQNVPGTTFPVSGLASGTYYFVVKATNPSGDSPASNERSVTVPSSGGGSPAVPIITTPPKKTNDTTPLYAGTSDPNVTITIFFSGSADGTTTADGSGHWTYHNTTSFKGDGIYIVTASASNAQETSASSAGVRTQVDTTPPDIPTNLQVTARDAAVVLTWSPSVATDTLGYNVYRKGPNDTVFHKINAQVVAEPHYVDSNLTNSLFYQYQVTAVDDTLNEAHP